MLDLQLLGDLVADARLAPSVHNIQPTRWALGGSDLVRLLEEPERALPVADPSGRDVAISHGAAIEGMLAALAARGMTAEVTFDEGHAEGRLPCRASLRLIQGPVATAAMDLARQRATWRGNFLPPTEQNRSAARLLDDEDVIAVIDPGEIKQIAALGDDSSMFFLRDPEHRRELLHWMRLSRRHPNWSRDGLSADAMQLGRLEAAAAGAVLGPLFRPLDRIGLAALLLAEKQKTGGATAILLFHRPRGEHPIATGRAYYQCWTAAEKAGFAACPMSVLADRLESKRWLTRQHKISADRELIGVFRIGPTPASSDRPRMRLPVTELIVS